MKNVKKLLTLPLAALALYSLTSCAKIEPYNVEFGQGYKCETRAKENKIKFYKDGKRIGEKTKTSHGDETYWFIDKEGNYYEETRRVFRIRPNLGYSGESAEEYKGYVSKKIKEGKMVLKELKEGECLLERLMENKPKKEPRRVGTVPLNEIRERQTSDLGLDLGGLEPYVTTGYFDYLKKHDKQFVIIYRR